MTCAKCGERKHPALFQKHERDKPAHLKRVCSKCKLPIRKRVSRLEAKAVWAATFRPMFSR